MSAPSQGGIKRSFNLGGSGSRCGHRIHLEVPIFGERANETQGSLDSLRNRRLSSARPGRLVGACAGTPVQRVDPQLEPSRRRKLTAGIDNLFLCVVITLGFS
jgi:hypothetical protein